MGLTCEMHAHALAHHRKRLLAAKSIVDDKPPIINASNFSRFSKLKADVYTFIERNSANCKLLTKFNCLVRTRGVIDTFRTPESTAHITKSSVLPSRNREMLAIEKANMFVGQRLLCQKAAVDNWIKIPLRLDIEREKNRTDEAFTVPDDILRKYKEISIPRNLKYAKLMFRPKIWFHLEVKGIRPLGIVDIQLFTEAAPEVVMEFVRICKDADSDRLKFVRLFPNVWIEGEMKLSENSKFDKNNIEYDKRVVDHGSHTGVLSICLDHIKICHEDFLYYTINLKPLRVLNGHRVGFGRIVRGLKILNCLQDYGTKNGKPTREIMVSKCGLYK